MHQVGTEQLKVTVLVNGKVIKRSVTRKVIYPLTGSSVLRTLVSYGTELTKNLKKGLRKHYVIKKEPAIPMLHKVTGQLKVTS